MPYKILVTFFGSSVSPPLPTPVDTMWRLETIVVLGVWASFGLAADEGSARVLQYDFRRGGDAQYSYSFETSNGIKRNETGDDIASIHDASQNAAFVKGSFSYPGADGVIYTVDYIADEAGFHPEGNHLKIPPFTPWIPGQPVDDGQYKEDKSGNYRPDRSGKYTPEVGEGLQSPVLDPKQNQVNYISGERILNAFRTTPEPPTSVTQIYLPTREPQKTNYVSGENILDTFLTAKKAPTTVTPKYLPASSTPQGYVSGESILDAFRQSSRPTPKYLPSSPTENPLDNDLIQKAFFNKPTPHPDILLHSTPRPYGAASQNKPAYVKFTPPKNEAKRTRGTRSFRDINPELRLSAGQI